MREYKGQQFTAMVLRGNSGIRGEDTKLPAERTGTRKRATWKKKKKMFRYRTLLQTIASCGTASARPT